MGSAPLPISDRNRFCNSVFAASKPFLISTSPTLHLHAVK
jgi:hypothetical protein